ncbi:hypothetical protein GEMRC1_010165 [Eukaryota sp. GEM-RC1]
MEYTSSCFRIGIENLVSTYSFDLRPLRGREEWTTYNGSETVLPPVYNKRVGRRRKKRFRRKACKDVKTSSIEDAEVDAIMKGQFDSDWEADEVEIEVEEADSNELNMMESFDFDIEESGLSPLDELLQY